MHRYKYRHSKENDWLPDFVKHRDRGLNTHPWSFSTTLRMYVVAIGEQKGRSRATGTRLAKSFGKRYDLFALYLTVTVKPNSDWRASENVRKK